MKDKMIDQLGLQVTAINGKTVHVEAAVQDNFFNMYGMAHGGYLYTFAHLATQLSAMTLLGGEWEMQDVSCMYLRPLRSKQAKAECQMLDDSAAAPGFRAAVYDEKNVLCFRLQGALRPAVPGDTVVVHQPKILSAQPMPKDPDAEPPFPCWGTTFTRYYNIYSVEKRQECLVYAADLAEVNCDAYGRAHPCALFTAADSAAGGSMVRIERKQPLTVSASMHYSCHTAEGLVSAVPHPVRKAKQMYFYDVDIIDGAGKRVAYGQFVLQSIG